MSQSIAAIEGTLKYCTITFLRNHSKTKHLHFVQVFTTYTDFSVVQYTYLHVGQIRRWKVRDRAKKIVDSIPWSLKWSKDTQTLTILHQTLVVLFSQMEFQLAIIKFIPMFYYWNCVLFTTVHNHLQSKRQPVSSSNCKM